MRNACRELTGYSPYQTSFMPFAPGQSGPREEDGVSDINVFRDKSAPDC